ncbi:DUF2625 domain-containing protein [Chitinophaga solisilvae]|uniref:DUF2625 domain-containing protein n=1 Tax=Chitinophaga solisilvae TaxID=1233460 RepID=UPI00136AD55E|nr:DUF2625 domain-containing protein [Chitinophaga solisilvae]
MRSVEELINNTDPGWIYVQEWIREATNKVAVLPVDFMRARDALYKTQVTTRSPMGAVVYMSGGILIDDGWIRILGSGSNRLPRTLPDWNYGKSIQKWGDVPSFLLIADDAIGGYYLLNGGGLGADAGKVYYFAPGNLEYEPLDITYTEFLLFCFNGDLEEFYQEERWMHWREDVAALSGDEVFSFYPFLWSREGKDINSCSRKAVPVQEQYDMHMSMRRTILPGK